MAVDCTVCTLYRFAGLRPESTALKRPARDLSEGSAGVEGDQTQQIHYKTATNTRSFVFDSTVTLAK